MEMERAIQEKKKDNKGKEAQKAYDQHNLQFAHSLKDLRNLREQLYSAARYFESSYHKDNHKQFVVESSKDYIGKALVSTVDHLGSVAHKLTILLDQKANDFSATNLRFSFIEQRLRTFHEFNNGTGASRHSLMRDANDKRRHHKHYNSNDIPVIAENQPCPPRVWEIMQNSKQDVSLSKGFLAPRKKMSCKKQDVRIGSKDKPVPPNTHNTHLSFSFTNKEPRKRSISPLGFRLKRTESFGHMSVSPAPVSGPVLGVARRAISACRTRKEATNRETEAPNSHSYTKASKQLFKALLNVHRASRKDTITLHSINGHK